VREIREEMGLDAEAGEMLGVVESQFEQHGKKHAEISLVYRLTVAGCHPAAGDRPPAKEDWIEFVWHDIADLAGANLLPPEMAQYVRG